MPQLINKNYIQKLLTCPVCIEPLSNQCFQCNNGHLICKNCLDYLHEGPISKRVCPECRDPLPGATYIRSRAAESLVKFMKNGYKLDDELFDQDCYEVVQIRHLQQNQQNQVTAHQHKNLINVLEISSENNQKSIDTFPAAIYRVNIDETRVTSNMMKNSRMLQTASAGNFVQVVEIEHVTCDKCIRGLLATGGWMTLFDLSNGCRYADPLHLGIYLLLEEVKVYEMFTSRSRVIQTLKEGTYVDLVKIRANKKENSIRAELADGAGWITLVSGNGIASAELMPLGLYKILSDETVVTKHIDYEEVVDVLNFDTNLDIIEVKRDINSSRVVGRLTTGGWIGLVDMNTGFKWAEPVLCF